MSSFLCVLCFIGASVDTVTSDVANLSTASGYYNTYDIRNTTFPHFFVVGAFKTFGVLLPPART